MDAEFYCLNEHVDAASQLLRYIDEYVDPTIALKIMNTDQQAWQQRKEVALRYTKLLHASIPPERELGIEADTETELFASRIYMRVYWPMLVQGYYWHPGVSDLVWGTYHSTYERQFHAWDKSLAQFLPALAIRDRMVLVPEGQNATLESMGVPDPARAPLERGVIEVDFADSDGLEDAFRSVGQELRRELRRELLAYQSFQLGDEIDFTTVAAHLGVPPSLLRHAIREQADAKELIYRQLRTSLEPTVVVKDIQTRLSLVVDNPSTVDLGHLRVQLRGPSTGLDVNPDRVEVAIPAASTVRVDYSVAATREGEFALEVLFLDADADQPRDMLPTRQLWLTSVARP
jgi:hypothetical protein